MKIRRKYLILSVLLAACGDTQEPVAVNRTLPVILQADVNVQIGDTEYGSRPVYTVTSFVHATQAVTAVSAYMDSIVLSYRLNDGPFVVGTALRVPIYSGTLPFTVQAGDHYTLYARLYAHANGAGGRTATAIDDFDASGIAVPPEP